MAIHIYMSVGKLDPASGKYIDPATKAETKVMRHRGEAGPNDDPVGFKAKMSELGHLVELQGELVGSEVERKVGGNTPDYSYEYNIGEV